MVCFDCPLRDLLTGFANKPSAFQDAGITSCSSKETTVTVSEEDDSSSSLMTSLVLEKDWRNQEVAVLVSDLSGFTSTTRKYGIVHFASVIIRMRQLVLPIFDKYGAIEITTEADNFITVFPSAESAVLAAIEMRGILRRYNASLSSERKHFGVKLNGIGLSCGTGVVMDPCRRLHGTVFRRAYHLGEDVCEKGDILVTQAVADVVRSNGKLGSVSLQDFQSDELEFSEAVFRIDPSKVTLQAELIDYGDVTYLPEAFGEFAARHDPKADLTALDASIKGKYSQQHTVLMYHLSEEEEDEKDESEDDEKGGSLTSVLAMQRALSVLRPVFEKHGATELEEELFLFEHPKDAVFAVLDAKVAISRHNQTNDDEKVAIEGWGIHTGTMIVVPETDIHWGDPVNTASKLGQDLATNSDFLISETVYEKIMETKNSSGNFENVQFTRKTLDYSGVTFTAYLVTRTSY